MSTLILPEPIAVIEVRASWKLAAVDPIGIAVVEFEP